MMLDVSKVETPIEDSRSAIASAKSGHNLNVGLLSSEDKKLLKMSPVLKVHLYLKTASIQRPTVFKGLLYSRDTCNMYFKITCKDHPYSKTTCVQMYKVHIYLRGHQYLKTTSIYLYSKCHEFLKDQLI